MVDKDEESAADKYDDAVSKIEKPITDLYQQAKKTKRNLRLLIVAVVFDISLSVGLITNVIQTHSLQHKQCEAGNEFRSLDKARWDYIIDLSKNNPPPPGDTSAGKVRREKQLQLFVDFIHKADALKQC